MAEPRIGVRIQARGVEDIRSRMEEIRTSGIRTFASITDASRQMGDAVEDSVERAGEAAQAAGSAARSSVGVVVGAVGVFATATQFVISGLSKIAAAAGVSGIALGAGFGAAYGGLRQMSLATAENIEQQYRLSQATGISVDTLTRWQAAARISGGTGEQVANAFSTVSRKIIEAAQGGEEAMKPFIQLDLQIRKSDQSLKSAEEVITEVATKLAEIQNPALRAKAAVDLFGAGASDLVPILSRGQQGMEALLKQADQYGTKVTQDQAKKMAEHLERTRRFNEALRGLNIAASAVFTPIFTQSSENMANWLQKNSERLRKGIDEIGKVITQTQKDVAIIFAGGDISDIGNRALRVLAGPLRQAKDIVNDLLIAMTGRGFGTVVPWVGEAANALDALREVAEAVFQRVRDILQDIVGPLPDAAAALKMVTGAFQSLRAGILGLQENVAFPAFRELGELTNNGIKAYLEFAAILTGVFPRAVSIANRAAIVISETLSAIRQVLQLGKINPLNWFAFLNEIIPTMRAAWDRVVADFYAAFAIMSHDEWKRRFIESFKDIAAGIGRAYDAAGGLFGIIQKGAAAVMGPLDKVAKFFGLKDGITLGVILLVGYFSGALKILSLLATIVGGLFTALGVVVSITTNVISVLVTLATFFGGLAVGVAVAVLAAVALIYYFRDEIWSVFKAVGNAYLTFFKEWYQASLDLFWNPLIALFNGLGAIVKSVFGGGYDTIVAVWGGLTSFFGGIIGAVTGFFEAWWTGVTNLPGDAWSAMTGLWGGLVDFFMAPIRKVADLFRALWDGVKNGASGAWNTVKGWFGSTGSASNDNAAPAGGGSLPSFDVGGYVPGARGAPLTATVHGGERILNLAETGLWERIMGGLASLGSSAVAPEVMAPAYAPAVAAGGGVGTVSTSFDINGRRIGGFEGSPGAMREMRMAMARGATSGAGRMPRWYGGY